MYLDKPLRAHTLFQALTRTNRRWTNPRTDQEKLNGLVVDYIGLGAELAKAVSIRDMGVRRSLPANVDELFSILADQVAGAMERFAGIDRRGEAYEQLLEAQERLASLETRAAFAEEFLRAEALFELLWPDTRLRPIEDEYRWLARVYKSVQPAGDANALLWHRLGAKTSELIGTYITDVAVDTGSLEAVAIDAETFEALRQLTLFSGDDGPRPGKPLPSVDEVLETVEARLARKLRGPAVHPVWRSLGRAAGGAARGAPRRRQGLRGVPQAAPRARPCPRRRRAR